jgi:tetratricopeptide (TPR) repeat protein
MIGKIFFRNKLIVLGLVLLILITSFVSVIFLSEKIADDQYQSREYKTALVLYQIHYSVFKNKESLIKICNLTSVFEDFETFLAYYPKLKPSMFENKYDYELMLSNYLVALLKTTKNDNYDIFFDEYQKLTPQFMDSLAFFTPISIYVVAIDSESLMLKTIDFLHNVTNLEMNDKQKSAAYLLMGICYTRLGQEEKAQEMFDISDQLDPQ